MHSEHRSSADEVDAFGRWRHVLAYLQRPGVRKKIKRISHRKDRYQVTRKIRDEWGFELGTETWEEKK